MRSTFDSPFADGLTSGQLNLSVQSDVQFREERQIATGTGRSLVALVRALRARAREAAQELSE